MSKFALQTILLSKEQFPSKQRAQDWIKNNKFKVTFYGKPVDEKENTWRFRQMAPSRFDPETYRTKQIRKGIQMVFGKLK